MATKKLVERAVVVSTANRGIFVGYTTDAAGADVVRLVRARMIVYYTAETRGFMGIASRGVGKGSRVSPAVPAITLRNVTAVVDASEAAVAAWEAEPWS